VQLIEKVSGALVLSWLVSGSLCCDAVLLMVVEEVVGLVSVSSGSLSSVHISVVINYKLIQRLIIKDCPQLLHSYSTVEDQLVFTELLLKNLKMASFLLFSHLIVLFNSFLNGKVVGF
jgi:hypothetical protein